MSDPKDNTSSLVAAQSVTITGSKDDDTLVEGYTDSAGYKIEEAEGSADKVNGNSGSDVISTNAGNDLAAGDMVGNEWSFVDGKWVYDPAAIVSNGDADTVAYNDTIYSGSGDDVVLGNGGEDMLYSGAGDDTVNAGTDDDTVFGGEGDDLLNLEDGDDLGVGGAGADTINAGDGDDLVYGDFIDSNVLSSSGDGSSTTFSQYAESSDWDVDDSGAQKSMSQSVGTTAGETYTISFDLAANLAAGATTGAVEVLWNGEVVGEVTTTSGVYETHSIEVEGTGGAGELTFRSVESDAASGPEINTDGPIFSYEKEVSIGGEDVTIAAFAPGQAKLYQVINGQLKVFDTAENDYQDAGDPTGIKVNAVGFNAEDDLIYGVAKSAGVDALGNTIDNQDLIMMDAEGLVYKIGKAPAADYVGDFDSEGNLWTFNSSLNRVSKIDVDNLDATGNPTSTEYDLPNDLFEGRTYDIAYNNAENVFYAVESPKVNGGEGTVHRIDFASIDETGAPEISSIPINGTLYGDEMETGLAKGAYGAVFLDGEGNLYYGLNRGDHDLDGSTQSSGAIFKVNMDWENGSAYSEFMSESQSTGINDGAVDPRSGDAFAPVDQEAPFLLRNPELLSESGGNDDLRGGAGDDVMYGGGGDDALHGGTGDDVLSGDAGNDRITGGDGNDDLSGGKGDDALMSGVGDDVLSGGAGKDYINASTGDDKLFGGDGVDKLVGGAGSDTIDGGAGDDHMWGGNWWRDGSSDTFIISAGGGKDMIHDFETAHDQIDLSSYGLSFDDIQGLMSDKGWATEIDLSGLDGASASDKLILKSISADDLDESNFIL